MRRPEAAKTMRRTAAWQLLQRYGYDDLLVYSSGPGPTGGEPVTLKESDGRIGRDSDWMLGM